MNASLLHNARVFTMAEDRPQAEAVAIRGGRIVAVGGAAEAARALDAAAERIDCEGGVLLSAFIDAHCHLLAYAASLRSVDCTAARRIADIQRAIGQRAKGTPSGSWIRAFGYEETALAEARHPTRQDLDAAAPDHPVRLIHGSGHASVLNSAALRLAGIDIVSEEPAGGAIDRDVRSGEPTGLLLGMEQRIEGAVPPVLYEELAAGVRKAAGRPLRAGVTCLQDATHTNGRSEWELFERLMADGALPLDVVLMEGFEQMGQMPETGGQLRRGAVKIMLYELGDDLSPDERELARCVSEVHCAGRQVAIHAIGERAVASAAGAIETALGQRPRADHRHRIEHCGLLPRGLAARMAELGIVVVSQPSFLFARGERYLRLIPEEQQGSLYAFRALRDAGVALAAGSDAPVTPPQPLASVAAAADRRTASGHALAPEQAVGIEEALRWWTADAAYAGFLEGELGTVRPGMRADLVLLPADALARDLRRVSPLRVWRSGQAVEAIAGEKPSP